MEVVDDVFSIAEQLRTNTLSAAASSHSFERPVSPSPRSMSR